MFARLMADAVVLVHLLFIAFVVCGGVMALRWPRLVWLHLPAAVWGVLIEFANWRCPLTPLENYFRRQGGEAGYADSFVEHYVLPVIYPAGLTRGVQLAIGGFVLVVNVSVYAWMIARRMRRSG